jgi:dipeptidyl aminopeptidase/acylaminoacyl peptidase
VTEAKFKATGEFDALNVLKLDTRTGASSTFQRPGETREWTIDPHDVPRVAVTKEQANRYAIQYLEPGSDTWAKLIEYEPLAPENGAFDPIGFAADGTLLVSHRRPGQGTMSLYTYDLKARKLSADPVFSVRGFDVHPLPIITREGLIGYRYLADAQSTYWTDPHMKEVQARIDKVLTGTVNILYVPKRAEAPFVAVGAYSDTEPGQYFLYDMKQDKLVRLGRSHPAIDARQMSPRELVRIKARDGLDIPVWVTAPKGEKQARPMVVLVHGGPWVRGSSWRWDPESEFLASRGYVVIEPEFRGSTGYGYALFRAGWKQWGLGMQNDVADAARWAIDKGIADPKRICIMGASYGGYATLMGLVNDPELFRCGIDLAGVTDIGLMYSITWSDTNDEIKTYGMPRLIGDPVKDADQLKKTSPVAQASRIKQPLLLAYGAQDRRVPIDHGKAFRDAVSATNNQVEWVVYPDEGHGLFLTKDRVDFYTRVEKFLARNIGDK